MVRGLVRLGNDPRRQLYLLATHEELMATLRLANQSHRVPLQGEDLARLTGDGALIEFPHR
jgi:hypothetical protein